MGDKMKVDVEIEGLKAVVREAHETIQTLRLLLREARPLIERLAQEQIDSAIAQQVDAAMESFSRATMEAIEATTEAVFARFDQITDLLLGKGQPFDIELYASKIKQARSDVREAIRRDFNGR